MGPAPLGVAVVTPLVHPLGCACLVSGGQVISLTGMDIANASLLDEGTAAAEAVNLVLANSKSRTVFVAEDVHPQTIGVIKVRMVFVYVVVCVCL